MTTTFCLIFSGKKQILFVKRHHPVLHFVQKGQLFRRNRGHISFEILEIG